MDILISLDLVYVLVFAAVLALLADKFKQPKLVSYLLAGLIVGPGVLALANPTILIELMAELGLAFLLFLIGLKLDFDEIKHIYSEVLTISLLQMVVIALATTILGLLMGFSLSVSVLIGLAVIYSSTAVVIKLLNDTKSISKEYGQINTGILLVQDLAVVVLMFLIASTATGTNQSILLTLLFLLFAIATTIIASQKILPAILRQVSKNGSVNLFITGLAWLFVFIIAAEFFGLSIEIGAFLAGLGLGQISYSAELVEKMSPVTDFFIAIFFINFGLNLSLGEFLVYWKEAAILAIFLMALKFGLISKLVEWQGFSKETAFKSGLTMTQTSEFSLIFAATAASAGYLSSPEVGLISLIAIITMSLSSYLILFHETIYQKLSKNQIKEKEGEQGLKDHAIIAGEVKGLSQIAEILDDNYKKVFIVDNKPLTKEIVADFRFGDFRHKDLRKQLNVSEAGFIMLNFEDESLARQIRKNNRNCKILAKSEEKLQDIKNYSQEDLVAGQIRKELEKTRGIN